MARRFKGENVHKMDSKGRVSVPASYRRVLAEGDPDYIPGETYQFVLVYSDRGRKCLEGYTVKAMDEIDDLIARLPRFSKKREFLERWLSAQSMYVTVEVNGRFVLSEAVRKKAGLKPGEITFAGMGDKFQIWDPASYAADTEALFDEFGDFDDEQNPFAMLEGIEAETGGGE